MDPYMLPFILRDSLQCLLFLVGVGAGVLAIVRNQRKVGIPILIGFLLLGIDPIVDLVIYNLISPAMSDTVDFSVFNWSYVCISGLFNVIGVLAILAGIYAAIQPRPADTSGPSEEVMTVPNP